MKTKSVLVIDDNRESLSIIQDALDEANAAYVICASSSEGREWIRNSAAFTHLLLRIDDGGSECVDLCREIRMVRSAEELQILIIVDEDRLELASQALVAGACDVLIAPFEARELRMRLQIQGALPQRRIDPAHSREHVTITCPEPAVDSENTDKSADRPKEPAQLILPVFDPITRKFGYDATAEEVASWLNDPSVKRVDLDQVLVCPGCSGVSSFRFGCGSCGSAWQEPEPLIHHYACAHVGAESEFRRGNELTCPKCHLTGLINGADFETVPGGHACAECGAGHNEPEMIGHCLSCQRRFPIREAVTVHLTGLYVQGVPEVQRDLLTGPKRRGGRQNETEKT